MIMNIHTSAGFQYEKHKMMITSGINFSHPGYAWAISRDFYDSVADPQTGNFLYEHAILGSGDNVFLHALFDMVLKSITNKSTEDYKTSVTNYQSRIQNANVKFGYVPGVIIHNFHGSKINRQYCERWKILVKYDFSPTTYLQYDQDGILIPSDKFPEGLKQDIMKYFAIRNEDE